MVFGLGGPRRDAAGPVTLAHTTTSGTFSLDGGTWDVENNVWVLGDHRVCVVIDAPHQLEPIADLIGDRILLAILCTHAHDDHVTVAGELANRFDAPIYLHPDDEPLWRLTYPELGYEPLHDGQRVPITEAVDLTVLHTPGHSPGAVCLRASHLNAVFTGDTLFHGGPGATGRSYSDYDTIVGSIRDKLFALPPETVVHTGHGEDTTIGEEMTGSTGWTRPQ